MSRRVAYLAGFFDGEGCVQIVKPHGTSLFVLSILVTNTDRNVLTLFQGEWGGSVVGPRKRKPGHKDIYVWRVDAKKAEKALLDLRKFLVVKRRQADVAILFRRLFKGKFIIPRGNADPEKGREKRERVMGLREDFYHQIRSLNMRGSQSYKEAK